MRGRVKCGERERKGRGRDIGGGALPKKASDTRPPPSFSGSLGVDLLLPSVSSFHDLFTTSGCELVACVELQREQAHPFLLPPSLHFTVFPLKVKVAFI